MKMKNLYLFLLSLLVVFTMSSCSKTVHPNAQKMIGRWIPEKVEKVYTPEQLQQMEQLKQQQAAAQSTGQGTTAGGPAATKRQPGTKSTAGTTGTATQASSQAVSGQPNVAKDTTRAIAGRGSNDVDRAARAAAALDRMVQSEMRAKLAINPDGSAQKFYPGKTVKATWKMKRNGKAVVARNIQTKEKFVLEIEELTDNRAVIIENLPVGTLRITYVKEQ